MDEVTAASNANPYQSPLIAADEHLVQVPGGSRALHVAVVALGATLGGFSLFVASVFVLHSLGFRDLQRHVGVPFACIPIGAVIGGLFAKWCALRFRPVR